MRQKSCPDVYNSTDDKCAEQGFDTDIVFSDNCNTQQQHYLCEIKCITNLHIQHASNSLRQYIKSIRPEIAVDIQRTAYTREAKAYAER